MEPLDEQLQNVLLEDREVLRGEQNSERSRTRLMAILAASAMPAGSSSVGTSSWIAKVVSSKIFLSSFLVVAIVGGVTLIMLNPVGDAERVNEKMSPPIEVFMQGEGQDRTESQATSSTFQPSIATENTEVKNVQNKTLRSERTSSKQMTPEESPSTPKNIAASEAIQSSDNQSQDEEKVSPVYKRNSAGVKVTVNPMKEEK